VRTSSGRAPQSVTFWLMDRRQIGTNTAFIIDLDPDKPYEWLCDMLGMPNGVIKVRNSHGIKALYGIPVRMVVTFSLGGG
jgi:hypothetical protein